MARDAHGRDRDRPGRQCRLRPAHRAGDRWRRRTGRRCHGACDMSALPFRPHELDQHPDGPRFEATIAELFGLDADPDLLTRIEDLEDEVAELEDEIGGVEANCAALRDALTVLLDAIDAGTVTPETIADARAVLTATA